MDDHSFMTQVEVLSVTDSDRRRRWSMAEKIRIVEESLLRPRMAASTARRYDISRTLLTRGAQGISGWSAWLWAFDAIHSGDDRTRTDAGAAWSPHGAPFRRHDQDRSGEWPTPHCFSDDRSRLSGAVTCGSGSAMIAFPARVRVWIAGGVTDMRCGMNTLALKVQQGLGRDPHGGEIFCFRGRKGDLIKILWHDGVGMSLYLKRLEAGKFIWPVSQNGSAVPVSAAQLGYLLEGIDWRNPRWTQRPASAG